MAVDALCSLLSSGSITATGSAGSWFDLKTMTPIDGLPIKVRAAGGSGASSPTLTITLQASSDASTVAETLWSKVITFTATNYAMNYEEVLNITTQFRYIRVAAPTISGTMANGVTVNVDIVTGRQNA